VPDDRAMQQKAGNFPEGDRQLVHPPTISLSKGGGAIRRIGEKFAANPITERKRWVCRADLNPRPSKGASGLSFDSLNHVNSSV
jgi:hypothetical protein